MWWNRRRVVNEIKRIKQYYNLNNLQEATDYIMKQPTLVTKEVYKHISTQDFPEVRREVVWK